MRQSVVRFLQILGITLVMSATILVCLYLHEFSQPLPLQTTQIVLIKRGDSFKRVIQHLTETGAVRGNRQLFAFFMRLSVNTRHLYAGEYEINPGDTWSKVADKIRAGATKRREFMFPPGITFQQLSDRFIQNPLLRCSQAIIQRSMRVLGLKPSAVEGAFFPSTYAFHRGDSCQLILSESHQLMKKYTDEAWQNRSNDLPYETPSQLLTVASMIEKETHIPEERALVSGVILNRLNRGMRLQIDPTVIYGSRLSGVTRVTNRLLSIDSPYNTYRRKGLPPTPICMPSLASIQAAARPAKTDALYYVATGSGGRHRFSKDYKAHLKGVRAYRQVRRLAKEDRAILNQINRFAFIWLPWQHTPSENRCLRNYVDSEASVFLCFHDSVGHGTIPRYQMTGVNR